jgi:transposase
MEPIVERVAGVDVGQATVVATILLGPAHKRPRKETRTFRSVTQELLAMRDWFMSEGVTQVAMESTGIYWRPVHAVLEDGFDVILGNAHHIRNVPGRKTDVKDSEWIADLARHGLIARSFVPPKPLRHLRDLLRYRRTLVETRSAERSRLLRLLETAQIKISSVASDVFGVSGMLMLRALAEGQRTPQEMAAFAKGKLLEKLHDLELALDGRIEAPHRFLLRLQLRRLDLIGADIEAIDREVDVRLAPYAHAHTLLQQIPGVKHHTAAILIAEIGTDMSVFRGPKHLAAWAGLCPGNNESAGKRKDARSRKGNPGLRTALIEAAMAASRKKGSYLKDKFYRLKARRGHRRAAVAIAHKILIAAYHMLRSDADYRDLGEGYLDRLDTGRIARNLVHRLERLGYEVDLKKPA